MPFDYSRSGYKELFANYGFASLKAQSIEKQLSAIIVAIEHIDNTKIAPLEFRALLDQEDKRTMGNLIRILQGKVSLPSDLENELNDILEKRNYLIHTFFISKGLDMGNEELIPSMNTEIIEIGKSFEKTITSSDDILEKIQNIISIPIDKLNEEAKKLFKLEKNS